MNTTTEDAKKPFHVRTNTGVFHSGHETAEQAAAAMREANARAETLGIFTRYETNAA